MEGARDSTSSSRRNIVCKIFDVETVRVALRPSYSSRWSGGGHVLTERPPLSSAMLRRKLEVESFQVTSESNSHRVLVIAPSSPAGRRTPRTMSAPQDEDLGRQAHRCMAGGTGSAQRRLLGTSERPSFAYP